MLSEKVINYCKSKNWWFDDVVEEYEHALVKLGIDLSSDFAKFYLHAEDGPTFFNRKREIYQICWFMINSSDYMLGMKRTHVVLNLPEEYIPLDSFVNCTLSSRQYKKIKLGNGLSSIFYRAKAIKFGL
ncbi:hypothetical protein MHI39_26110 [Heyndrickxia sp. FSL K6-6286]|uniref:hypothetical protein n=1 Tax=Heyndrickxia sp. FSL K6-6286 TaxID=2921510 RepID=UPI00315B2162